MLAKNTQCSNSRFNPLKLPQTYNHTPRLFDELRSAIQREIWIFWISNWFKILQ